MSRTLVAICLVLAMASVGFGDVVINWSAIEGADLEPGTNGALYDLYTGPGFWALQADITGEGLSAFTGQSITLQVTTLAGENDSVWTDIGKIKIWVDDAPEGYDGSSYLEVSDTVAVISGSTTGTDWGSWNGDSTRLFTWDLSGFNTGTTVGATTIHIAFSFNTAVWGSGTGGVFHIDNAQIVPEPATMTLLGLGGLALIRRKK